MGRDSMSSADYQALRQQVYDFAGGRCEHCGERAQGLDHIITRSKGGPDHWNNVWAACNACNGWRQESFRGKRGRLVVSIIEGDRKWRPEFEVIKIDSSGAKFVERAWGLWRKFELDPDAGRCEAPFNMDSGRR